MPHGWSIRTEPFVSSTRSEAMTLHLRGGRNSCGSKWLSGWWLSHPSEKYESQLGLLFPIYGKI